MYALYHLPAHCRKLAAYGERNTVCHPSAMQHGSDNVLHMCQGDVKTGAQFAFELCFGHMVCGTFLEVW